VRRRLTLLYPCFVLPVLTGCAPEPDEVRLGKAPAAIEGGYVDDFDTHVVGVARIGNNGGAGLCSGTLITPNLVLTARHCVAATSSGESVQCGVTSFYPNYQAQDFHVTTKVEFSYDPTDYHNVAEVHVPPGGNQFCGNDQAMLILSQPIPPEEALPAIPRVDTALADADVYYAVGYGAIYDGGPSGTRYRRDALITDCVGASCSYPGIAEQEWLGQTAVCSGDSGGPAFDMQNRVVGVASRGSPGCETPIYGHVFGWGQWIKDVANYAAGLAGIEAPPWATGYPTDPAYSHPVGAACDAPEQCPSGMCMAHYCTRICSDLAPCPSGFSCNGDLICEKDPEPPKDLNEDEQDDVTVGGCVYGTAGDPTKPIPWKLLPPALLLVLLRRRRRSVEPTRQSS
jgi:trypsin